MGGQGESRIGADGWTWADARMGGRADELTGGQADGEVDRWTGSRRTKADMSHSLKRQGGRTRADERYKV